MSAPAARRSSFGHQRVTMKSFTVRAVSTALARKPNASTAVGERRREGRGGAPPPPPASLARHRLQPAEPATGGKAEDGRAEDVGYGRGVEKDGPGVRRVLR